MRLVPSVDFAVFAKGWIPAFMIFFYIWAADCGSCCGVSVDADLWREVQSHLSVTSVVLF